MGMIVSRRDRGCAGEGAAVSGPWRRAAPRLVASWLPIGVLLTACTDGPSVVDPRGPAAASVATLWWILLGITAAVCTIVTALLILGVAARRRARGVAGSGRGWIEVGGVLLPTIILAGVLVLTLGTMRALSAPEGAAGPTIEVVGHQWWWEVRYPDQRIVTANEIHLPVGQNIVIGGAAGSFPPLVGWAAVTGQVGPLALCLAAIVFCWTPPHFWALALLTRGDYAAAGIPMLPNVAGEVTTRRYIVRYTALLLVVTLLPYVMHAAGWPYLLAAGVLGLVILALAWRLALQGTASAARALFRFSNTYLALLFLALVLDRLLA